MKLDQNQLNLFDNDCKNLSWYDVTQAILMRHFADGESVDQICDYFRLDRKVGPSRIAQMRSIPINCQCLKDFQSGKRREDRYPKPFQQNHSSKMALEIARELERRAPNPAASSNMQFGFLLGTCQRASELCSAFVTGNSIVLVSNPTG